MKGNKKESMVKRSFPDYLAPDEEKLTDDYGLSMGKAIEYEWWYRPDGSQCRFHDKRDRYHELRLYARGEQDTKYYKDMITGGDDTSYSNYDWRPLQVAPKFLKLLTNQMSERLFDIRAEAVDKFSTDLRDDHKARLEGIMKSVGLANIIKEDMGFDVMPADVPQVPDTQEELDLYMSMDYKPNIEIATEQALKFTFDINNYKETQQKNLEDIATIGIAAIKHETDPNKGIRIKYVDPAECVYSFPKHRNFEDVHYYGEVVRMTINELKRVSNGKFTDEELKNIASSSSEFSKYQNPGNTSTHTDDDLEGMMVDVLHFTFKSTKTISYKKKFNKNGGYKMTKKGSTFKKTSKEYKGYDVSKKIIDAWYQGSLILGTEKVFNYKLCENMIRPKGNINITYPNYLFYAPDLYQNRTKSLIGNIIPYIDQMQQIHIKLQQLIAKARPNGVFIDVDGLQEIPLGDGSFLTPMEVIKIYDETGNVLGTSKDASGEYNHGKEPIRELKNGIVDGLDRLIGAYNHYLNLLRDAIGIPQGADASTPNPKMAVGVQEQLSISSNTATRHVLDSVLNITESAGKAVALRLKDIFLYSNLKDVYINAVGSVNVEILNSIKDYHLHDIGINIELRPDAREKQMLENNIQQALAQQSITVDDAQEIRQLNNSKLANQLLRVRRKKREQEKREHELSVIEKNNQGQASIAQQSAQNKQAEIQMQAQSKMAEIQAKTQGEIAVIKAEEESKARLMGQEFQYNMTLKGAEQEVLNEAKRYDNDRKDARQREAATQSSKISEQKQFNKPAMSFESSEDNISGGVEMGELGPQ